MLPTLPSEIVTSGWELLCAGLTVAAALLGYLLTWR
jgi:hypothetical protein